jgi:hypothetical protein
VNTAEQRLDFLRYKGRIFVEVPGLTLWLWKQHDKAVRDGMVEGADVLRAIIERVMEDSP